MSKTKIKVHQTASLSERIADRFARVRHRAFEIFERRGTNDADRSLDDWLMAERQLAAEPVVDLSVTEDGYELEAALPGMDADEIIVEATGDDVLIVAERRTHHHGKKHRDESVVRMFRVIHFPEAIDPDHVKADYREGLLHLTAARAKPSVAELSISE